MKTVITYGTFDLFHIGHLRLLERLAALGDRFIVAVSTDEFNRQKGKRCFIPYEQRAEIVEGLRCVDKVIPEKCWEQKEGDIGKYSVDIFGMGDDWKGKFDHLKPLCDVVYLPRTTGVSSTALRKLARTFDEDMIRRLSEAQGIISDLIADFNDKGPQQAQSIAAPMKSGR